VSNEEILKRAGIKSIETFISTARLRWYGHIVRMPDSRLPKFLLDLKPKYGKRSKRRPVPQELEGLRTRGCH
jgi:transcription termination factor 2